MNHLGQVTIAHLPGHKPAKGDLGVKHRRGIQVTRSREHRCVTRPPGAVYAAVSSGPPHPLEPEGRHDVNLRPEPTQVRRSGYGAMQLAGPYAFGMPPDRASAIGVLQAAVAAGVDHIDTA